MRTAEYYVVAANGERLYRLSQFTELAGGAADPRQVGIVAVSPPRTQPAAGPLPLPARLLPLLAHRYEQVGQLTFVVARHDSLAIHRQWFR